MKNFLLPIFLLLGVFAHSQIVNIPDANFKHTLLNIACVDTNNDGSPDSDADLNNDGEIQVSEAEAVWYLSVYKLTSVPDSEKISSLEGIQSFTNLRRLKCWNNLLTELDLSQNLNLNSLDCRLNRLTTLNVSQNTGLFGLTCSSNLLTDLDVSNNVNLNSLRCSDNM
ncbi:MAG: T9SS C-terminal target domain-containing protein, partial [Flavobacteriaceae bacterium]|nr:T9SS C-terminal target domain-containing protein [Flavobacteriaceae bacterium]